MACGTCHVKIAWTNAIYPKSEPRSHKRTVGLKPTTNNQQPTEDWVKESEKDVLRNIFSFSLLILELCIFHERKKKKQKLLLHLQNCNNVLFFYFKKTERFLWSSTLNFKFKNCFTPIYKNSKWDFKIKKLLCFKEKKESHLNLSKLYDTFTIIFIKGLE